MEKAIIEREVGREGGRGREGREGERGRERGRRRL